MHLSRDSNSLWGNWKWREKGIVDSVVLERRVDGDCRGYVVLEWKLNGVWQESRFTSSGCVLREASGDGEVSAALDA